MSPLPAVVTHNYHPHRGAFRNICDLSDADAERVLDEIRAAGTARLRPSYLRKRRATEAWLTAERTRKLGDTPLHRPIYFFLGDFADGQDPARLRSFLLPLEVFAPETLTFTYPDSMASFSLARGTDRKPHHGRVFTLDEIETFVADQGMPDPRGPARHDRFIEVQVWDKAPLVPPLPSGDF